MEDFLIGCGVVLNENFQLMYVKSPTDRSMSVLHVIAQTVKDSFPQLLSFAQDFKFAEKASKSRRSVSLFAVSTSANIWLQ